MRRIIKKEDLKELCKRYKLKGAEGARCAVVHDNGRILPIWGFSYEEVLDVGDLEFNLKNHLIMERLGKRLNKNYYIDTTILDYD